MEKSIENNCNIVNNLIRKILDFEWRFIESLSLKISFLDRYIIKLRKKITLEECKMAEISSSDRVLVIGCGPHPTTALLIVNKTQAQVVGIDKKINAVKLASSYIQKNNLENKIYIYYADGIDYPIDNFDVIFIAANVWPIKQLINNIFSKINNDVKIICRDFREDITNMVTNGDLSEICYIESYYNHWGYDKILNFNHKSILLKKRK